MSKVRTSWVVGTLVAAFAVAGCGGASSSGSSPTAPVSVAAAPRVSPGCAGTPVAGGNLVYARGVATDNLNNMIDPNGNGDIFAYAMLYQGLVQYAPNDSGKIVGALAKSWNVSTDGKSYTFHLRPGIKFSNGQPITAEDIKYSLDRFGNPHINQGMAPVATGYGSLRIVNPSTIKITLRKPVPAFLDNISTYPAFVVPETLLQKEGSAFWRHPVGSGPFKFKELVTGSHLTLERNPYYWDAPKPYLNSVRFDFASDANSRLLALTSGSAQMADLIAPSQFSTIKGNASLALAADKVPQWISMFLNQNVPAFTDLKVRQAMAYAVDRTAINKEIFDGLGIIPNDVFGQLKYDGSTSVVPAYRYDIAKAKALMAQSRYPKGFAVTLQYPAGLDYFGQLSLVLQQQLAAIGIRIKLVQLDPATMTSNFYASKFDISFGFSQMTSDIYAPDEYASFWADPHSGTNGFFMGWANPAIAAQVATFTSTPSESSRATQWPKIQAALMSQQPDVNVIDLPFFNAYARNVCGAEVNAMGVDQLQNTWFARSH